MTKLEIEEKYNKLIEEVKTKEYYTSVDLTNRVNAWICETNGAINPHVHGCRDIDAGVTPFTIKCETCGGWARSLFYRVHLETVLSGRLKIEYEWYRPSLEETLKESPEMIEHILRGGLKMRKIREQKGEQKHD